MSKKNGLNRRQFIRNSAIGVGAMSVGMSSPLMSTDAPTQEKPELKIKEYRTLGRTGFKVSDISSGIVENPAIIERMIDAGINYIDSAESYGNEETVGKAIKNRDRKSLFITTKLTIEKDVSKEAFLKRARECLKRLDTPYVDCLMMHMPDKAEYVKLEGFHSAMSQLKTEGKVRFVGISHHGSNWYRDAPESMEKVLTAAALDGRFDVMLLAYNFIQQDNGAKILELCKEKNIGTTLMKVNPIGNIPLIQERIEKLKESGKEIPPHYPEMIQRLEAKQKQADAFIKKYNLSDYNLLRAAAIRFCLSNPNVHTVCCSFRNFDLLDLCLALSGTRLEDMEKKKLAAYKEGCGNLYCRHACGLCEPSCPHGIPVNTIMRYNHYFDAQGKEKYAMEKYAQLKEKTAGICATCQGHCEAACPYDVPVHGLLTLAHQTLSFNYV